MKEGDPIASKPASLLISGLVLEAEFEINLPATVGSFPSLALVGYGVASYDTRLRATWLGSDVRRAPDRFYS